MNKNIYMFLGWLYQHKATSIRALASTVYLHTAQNENVADICMLYMYNNHALGTLNQMEILFATFFYKYNVFFCVIYRLFQFAWKV